MMKMLYVIEDDPKAVEENGGYRLSVYVMDVKGEWALVLVHTSDTMKALDEWLDGQEPEIIEHKTTDGIPIGSTRGALQ
jgi:hypothetical protein